MKKKIKESDSSSYSSPIAHRLTDKHRKFYINGELFFALFYDSAITDKKKILEDFLASRDWKDYKRVFEVKEKEVSISKDLKEVYIETTKHREKDEED